MAAKVNMIRLHSSKCDWWGRAKYKQCGSEPDRPPDRRRPPGSIESPTPWLVPADAPRSTTADSFSCGEYTVPEPCNPTCRAGFSCCSSQWQRYPAARNEPG